MIGTQGRITLGRMTQTRDGEAFLHSSEVSLTQRLIICGLGGGSFYLMVLATFFPSKGPSFSEKSDILILLNFGLMAIGLLVVVGGLSWRSTFIRVSRDRIEVESANVFDAFEGTYGPQDVLWMRLRSLRRHRLQGAELRWRLTLSTADGRKHDTLPFGDRREALEVKREMERSFFGPQGGAFPEAKIGGALLDAFR